MKSVNEVVELASEQVELAYNQKTFAVGGILMDVAGNVIHAMHNNVVEYSLVKDPTAHGERQLIDWYFENRYTLGLPSPDRMVLVTSLDPCAMCTGAILSSGFHLVIISAPDKFAGINYNQKADFPTLSSTGYESTAARVLAYPEIRGDYPSPSFDRDASGAQITIFPEDSRYIDSIVASVNELMFTSTVEEVSALINQESIPTSELRNLALEGADHWIYQEVVSRYSSAFRYKASTPGKPGKGLAPFLKQAAQQDIANGGSGEAVAFLDYFGNLLLCSHGTRNISPIQTAFMHATRLYAELRYEVARRGSIDSLKYLCHPKYGTFVMVREPDGEHPRTLMDLGAYGSTMEGSIPDSNQLQYVIRTYTPGTPAIHPYLPVNTLIHQMPPFYTDVVKIKMTQVEDSELIEAMR